MPDTQLFDRLRSLTSNCLGEKIAPRRNVCIIGQHGQELTTQVRVVLLTSARFPHFQKLSAAIGAITETWIRKSDGIASAIARPLLLRDFRSGVNEAGLD